MIGLLWLYGIAGFKKSFEVPEIFVAISSAAVGAVAGLLTPTPQQTNEN
jgi:hypothetical protein